jgi:hypothetical protein
VGRDTNIANIWGLFGMNWVIPGTQVNPTVPRDALVLYVRTSYVAQTLVQMREASPLSPDNAPPRSPIFVPGCCGAGPDFDAPLASFVRMARRVIDPAFVTEEP